MTDEIVDSQGTGTLNRTVKSVFQLEANLPCFLLLLFDYSSGEAVEVRHTANRQQLRVYWRDRLEDMVN